MLLNNSRPFCTFLLFSGISLFLIACSSENDIPITDEDSYLEPVINIEEYTEPALAPTPPQNNFLIGKWTVTGQTEGFTGRLTEYNLNDYTFEYLNDSILDVTISQNFASSQTGQYFTTNSMLGQKAYDYEYVLNPYTQEYVFFSGNEHFSHPPFQSPGDNYNTVKYEHKLIVEQTDTLMEIDLGNLLFHGNLRRASDSPKIYLKKI